MRTVVWISSLSAFLVLCASAAESIRVVGTTLSASFDAKGSAVRLLTAQGAELGARDPAALFSMTLCRTDDFTRQVVVGPERAKCRVEKTSEGARFVYTDLGEACRSVVCTVRGGGENLRWGISVEAAPGWALEKSSYPRLRVTDCIGSSAADDRFVYGTAKGGVWYPSVRHAQGDWYRIGRQPGDLACAFACLYDDLAGFYFAAEDSAGHAKMLGAQQARTSDGILFLHERICFDEGVATQSYEVVTGGLEGTPGNPCTWHDAADRYRAWVERQSWCTTRFPNRTDLPVWMKDAPAMVRFTREWLERPEDILRWVRDHWRGTYPQAPLVMAYWGWEKRGNWVGPDYYPVICGNAAFTRLVATCRELDAHAFPWPSGYHWTLGYDKGADGVFSWDDRDNFMRRGAAHAVQNRDGKLRERVPGWLKGGSLACLCGGDPWTIDWFSHTVCEPLAKMGCEMIQVDQVVGGAFPPCWNRQHPHTPNEGTWKARAFREQLVSLRTMMKRHLSDAVVCFEEPDELFNDLIGIQDYRDCESSADEWASVFNYVYHDYVPCFQSNPRRGNRFWQAHCAVDGQIPFLTPSRRDGAPPEPALENGGFERLTTDRRFAGWSQVDGYNGKAWKGRYAVDDTERKTGARAIRLEVRPGENAVQVAQNVDVQVKPFTVPGRKFRLSAWLKSDHLSQADGVGYCFLGGKGGGRLQFPKPEAGWQRVSSEFTIPEGARHLRIMLNLTGDARAWVDDLRLEDLAGGEVMSEGGGPYEDFMRRWIALYHGEGRDFLAWGHAVKPPRLRCAKAPYDMTLRSGRMTRMWPAVQVAAYVARDGRRAAVVANATGRRQSAELLYGGRCLSLTLEADELRLLPLD